MLKSIDAYNICQIIIEEAEKFTGGRQRESRTDSQKDNDINALDEKRKTLRNKGKTSNRE